MRTSFLFALIGVLVLERAAFGADEIHEPGGPAWWLIGLFTLQGIVIWLFSRRRYLVWRDGKLEPAFSELQEFSSYLLSGAVIAQLWVHGDPGSYRATVRDVLLAVPWLGTNVTLHFLANEVLMTFFFGIAAKELAEATLKSQGSLRGRRGFLPMMACAGGVIGPALVYRAMRDGTAGLFAEEDATRPDSINLFEQSHKPFVDTGLFYFGLANAGVLWWGGPAWDRNAWAVFLGLGVGKTLGIALFAVIGFSLLQLPRGEASLPRNEETGECLTWGDVPLVGLLGAMGFTVALFVAEAAGGAPSLKLGALASFAFLAVAVVLGKVTTKKPTAS
jgi:Na+/H+ antiporter NhaA